MAEDNKITLNETHPNAFSTIREDLETISNEAVYWTDFDGIIDEIYPDTFQQKLIEIESKLYNKMLLTPCISFRIAVSLYRSSMDGIIYDKKIEYFNADTILFLINRAILMKN